MAANKHHADLAGLVVPDCQVGVPCDITGNNAAPKPLTLTVQPRIRHHAVAVRIGLFLARQVVPPLSLGGSKLGSVRRGGQVDDSRS